MKPDSIPKLSSITLASGAELLPGNVLGIAFLEHLDGLAVDDQRVVLHPDRPLEAAQDRIVLQQVREYGRFGQVVDGNELEVAIPERAAQQVAPDPPETVNS